MSVIIIIIIILGIFIYQCMWTQYYTIRWALAIMMWQIITGDPLHSRALAHSRAPLFTQPRPHCSHSRAPGEQWARLCVFTLQGCVQAARLCRGSPVIMAFKYIFNKWYSITMRHKLCRAFTHDALASRPVACIYVIIILPTWRGYTLVSPCPSVHLWTEWCPLCIFNNTRRIHFIFTYLIKQLQKVCRM